VSYFLRASRMYDTLMQMGRWFGYRPGYLDLCRLYTTPELNEWFQYITEANEELRLEFDQMAAVGGTPRDYGLRVRSHPAMMITSKVKLRTGIELQLSYAGSISETVVFYRGGEKLDRNYRAAEDLLRRLGPPTESSPQRNRPGGSVHTWSDSCLWTGVPATEILTFLGQVVTHPTNQRVDSRLLSDYIERQNNIGELQSWTISLISGEGERSQVAELNINLVRRSPNERSLSIEEQRSEGRYIIRRLLSPRDEAIDLNLDRYQAALMQTVQDAARSGRREAPGSPSGPRIRAQRDPGTGLLLLYPLCPSTAQIEEAVPVIGFGISFPSSDQARTVTYRVNNTYWSQEYGGDL
jgi:hypothetical protein